MQEEEEGSMLTLLQLLDAQQNRPDVILQALQLLLQCSGDTDFLNYFIKTFENKEKTKHRALVISSLRRLLRYIGGTDGRLSAMATEILINLTANDELGALMLAEYKDMTSVLMENLKRQQQQQHRSLSNKSDDDIPLHLGISLMLLSNVTRHKVALETILSPDLPLPDYNLLPCILLLYDAPRDPQAMYWKEQGIFLLHILQNITVSDEAVVFLLTRRMQTINKIMDLLRYMPPLCQAPFLTLALRLACREHLHHLLLPTAHETLQKQLEEHCRLDKETTQQTEQHQQTKESKPRPDEDCRLLLALCCFLYPKAGSPQRAKAREDIAAQDAEEQKQQEQQQEIQDDQAAKEEKATNGVTERQRLRFLHPAVDASSYGPAADTKARSLAVDCLAALATSPHARETLRWFGVYEVLRAVFCIESDEAIRDKIEEMVHVLVFSEEELQQQDRQLTGNQKREALCSGDAKSASPAIVTKSS